MSHYYYRVVLGIWWSIWPLRGGLRTILDPRANSLHDAIQIRWQGHAVDVRESVGAKFGQRSSQSVDRALQPENAPSPFVNPKQRGPQALVFGIFGTQVRVQLFRPG
jgi:hypothetical protein